MSIAKAVGYGAVGIAAFVAVAAASPVLVPAVTVGAILFAVMFVAVGAVRFYVGLTVRVILAVYGRLVGRGE